MSIYRWLRTRQWKQQCIRNEVTQPCVKPSRSYVRMAYWDLLNHHVKGRLWKHLQKKKLLFLVSTLQWRHNERYGVPNRQVHNCLPKLLFSRRSKKTSKLRATGLCEGNSPVTDEFPAQRASNTENVSIWWLHHHRDSIVVESPWFNRFQYGGWKAVVTHNANINIVAMHTNFQSGWTIPNLNITAPRFHDVLKSDERPRSE